MKKILKMVFTFLMALSVMGILIPTTVMASEETEAMISVYVHAPDSWKCPNAWAWNEDGTNAFEVWPGEGFEKDESNDGWYYIWLPGYANHVIVSAADESAQTEEIILDEKNAWITISDDGSFEISYEAQTEGVTPEYVEKFPAHVTAPNDMVVSLTAVNDDESEIYTADVSITANEYTTVKIPAWTSYIFFSNNDVNGEKTKIDPVELWISLGEAAEAELSYIDPAKANIPNIKVNVKAPADWENPCLWAWSAPDGTNVYSAWPGESFVNENEGWLQLEVPGWVNSIIINANEGSVQTGDMAIETEKDVWIVVTSAEEYEVFYEQPATDEIAVATTETTVKDSIVLPVIICVIIGLIFAIIAFFAHKSKSSK